jgi:hypothetical protein
VVGQFTIAQFVNGNSVLSVIPNGSITFTGPDTTRCASGASATFYIFGGTPPYTVVTNLPDRINLTGTPVPRSGAGFTITTNGSCFENLTFAITDAAGRTLLTPPTVTNERGTDAPPPATLVLTPTSIGTSSAPLACGIGAQLGQILATGGTGTYVVAVSPQGTASGGPVVATAAGGQITVSVSNTSAATPAHGDFAINVSSGSQLKTATLHCSP